MSRGSKLTVIAIGVRSCFYLSRGKCIIRTQHRQSGSLMRQVGVGAILFGVINRERTNIAEVLQIVDVG